MSSVVLDLPDNDDDADFIGDTHDPYECEYEHCRQCRQHWMDEKDDITTFSLVNPRWLLVRQWPWGAYLPEPRGFTADAAFPVARVLVELKGNAHAKGWTKVKADIERERIAVLAGWRVLCFIKDDIESGVALAAVRAALENRNAE